MAEFDRERDAAVRAARAAGQTILECLRRGARIGHKQPHNLVSDADTAAEAEVIGQLSAQFPDHAFFAEEQRQDSLRADAVWIIDPLDGTNSFAHRFPFFCTSIGLAVAGELVVGVIFDPVHDELFTATRGGGAFLNGAPIRVSAAATLAEVLLATGFYYDRGVLMQCTLDCMGALFKAGVHGIRLVGSAALHAGYVGCGRLDGFCEYRLMPWDFAAAAVIVREAGGAATDTHGRPLGPLSKDVAFSNGRVHDELLQIVARHRPPPESLP